MSEDKTQIAVRGSTVSVGAELNQTYKIDSLIGAGGMGEVYRGHNIQTGDPVAIKIVLPEFARDSMILDLFRKEARILNHLNHEAIVRYYVFSIDPVIGRPYLAMEFVDGQSLAERGKSTPFAAADFMPLLRRLADGLLRAHEAGVIHRDISPDNVILPGGLVRNAKIIDFGIARSANVGGETLLGGNFAGKYNYVSPEQLGLFGGEVTPKSDIYSLALVMAAAMRGKPLDMNGSQFDVIEKRRVVPDLSDIPYQFRPVLSAMLQPDPAARPASMAEVRDWSEAPKPSSPKPAKHAKADRRANQAASLAPRGAGPAPQPSNAIRNLAFGAAAIAVIGIGVLAGWIYVRGGALEPASVQTQEPEQSQVSPPKKDAAKEPPKDASPAASVTVQPKLPVEPKLQESTQIAAVPRANVVALMDFIGNFGPGTCLNAKASTLTATSAVITLLGTASASQDFTTAFESKAGFTPQIVLEPVSPEQCAFVSAIRRMSAKGARPLGISLGKPEVRGNNAEAGEMGDPLNVTANGVGERNAYLFVMDYMGGIQNINRLCASCITMKTDEMNAALSLYSPAKVDGETPPPFYPMLVFVVASPKPLISINSQDAFDASDFIEPLLKEIEGVNDVATSVAFVKLKVQ